MTKHIKPKINDDRGVVIDNVQGWFLKRNRFWRKITILVLACLIILQISLTFMTGINSHIRLAIYPILISLLLLFVFSIFWRNTITAFLSLAGALCLFVGMYYAYAGYEIIQTMPSSSSSHTSMNVRLPPVATVAAFYFLMGLFSAFLCLGVAFKPSFFRARGAPSGLPYPVWSINDPIYKSDANSRVLSLIPIQSLLNFSERHLISNYKYIQVIIGGTKYFVSLDEWVPQSMTYIVRDRQSGSLVGIPKVSNGFNI